MMPAVLIAQTMKGASGSHRIADAIPMKAVVHQVPPEYPYEARRSHIIGSGILSGQVDIKTGIVTSVAMEKSTGNTILDQAALNAFRQWRFKPGTVRHFRTPINFTMGDFRNGPSTSSQSGDGLGITKNSDAGKSASGHR